ncbi:MAG TPA: 3-deoxy-D-manno-octulosonic acid transferase [Candidatus Avidesulfovibrio excrementigallinarum]|nr:3-deoxy-D-manno-octulosonic acid transferase [Candidatus Avidesulfovibrio excrementigallinarum]
MSLEFRHVVLSRLYGLAWRLARPALRRNKRMADGWSRRLVPDDWARPADLWIQAASGGEAYLVNELVNALPPRPDGAILRILATTWTRQGLEVLQGIRAKLRDARPDLDIEVTLFPLDSPVGMYRAVRQVNPSAVVLLETELWPGLLFACVRRHIPVAIINGRMTPKSLKGYRWIDRLAPGFWQAVAPALVTATTRDDAARFARLFDFSEDDSRLHTVSNIKFDRAAQHAETACSTSQAHDELLRLLPDAAAHPIILLASVREEEEVLLEPVIRKIHEQNTEATVVIAPRHMHRVESWMQRIGQSNLSAVRRSDLTEDHPAMPGQIVIWDTFGELNALYALAGRVFVGGSLAPLGGQNILEPLAHGRVPLTGPYTNNFNWAMDDNGATLPGLVSAGMAVRCADANQLAARLLDSATDSPDVVRQRFLNWLEARRGGTKRCVDLLEKLLNKTS